MLVQLQQESLTIGRKPLGFTQHYYTEWDDGLGQEKISMFLVLTITSSQVAAEEVGKEAFQLLQDHFLHDLSGDPYDRFENALREINVMVNEKEKEMEVKFIHNVHILGGVIQKDMLFLSQRGDAQAYLVRKRHVSSISEGLYDEKNTHDLFQNIASGVLEVNDTVILTTGKLIQYVTPSDFSKIFSEQSLSEATTELKELLGTDLEEQMALLAFEVLEKMGESAPAVLPKKTKSEEKIEEEMDAEPKKKKKASLKMPFKTAELSNSLSILRDWAGRQERLQVFKNLRTWGRDKILIAIVVAVLVLGGGVTYAVVVGGKQKQIRAMEDKLAVAEDNLVQAETRGAFDKAEAATLLDEAEDLAVEVLNSGYLRGNASELLDKVAEERDFLDNVIRVSGELNEVADFSTLIGSDKIVGVSPYQDRIAVYTSNNVYQVLIDQVQPANPTLPNEKIISGNYFADPQNLVLLTESGQVIEYIDGNSQFADTADGEWKGGVDVVSYSTKLYLLDPEEKQIWRYQRSRTGYGSAQAYLASTETDLDLSSAISVAVDGSVWVLMEDGSIEQLLSGEQLDYELVKEPLASMENATQIYTELEIPQLFVVDPSENRLFVFDKSSRTNDLTYASQYLFEEMKGNLVDIYLDKDRDVYVLVSDQALYELTF